MKTTKPSTAPQPVGNKQTLRKGIKAAEQQYKKMVGRG